MGLRQCTVQGTGAYYTVYRLAEEEKGAAILYTDGHLCFSAVLLQGAGKVWQFGELGQVGATPL